LEIAPQAWQFIIRHTETLRQGKVLGVVLKGWWSGKEFIVEVHIFGSQRV